MGIDKLRTFTTKQRGLKHDIVIMRPGIFRDTGAAGNHPSIYQ